MALTLSVRFVHGTFDATAADSLDSAEWPPHPARVFAGLVACAESEEDFAALDWLEQQGPPVISASEEVVAFRRENFVITNEMKKEKTHMEFPGRSGSGRRVWPRVCPSHPIVGYRWDVDPTTHAGTIAGMCRRMPYLGRSTSPVVAWMDTEPTEVANRWEPDASGSVDLTVPAAGLRARLADAYEVGQMSWSVPRTWCRYRSPSAKVFVEQPIAQTPYRDLIIFGISGSAKPSYQSVVRYTAAFRAAVMNVLSNAGVGTGPPALHGHPAIIDGRSVDPPKNRVMFLGLPIVRGNVSAPASGHLLGFAVAIPSDLSDGDRADIYRGLVGVERLFGENISPVTLTRSELRSVQALSADRWCRPARVFTSVYPVVLDRYFALSDVERVEDAIRRTLTYQGLDEPSAIEWSKTPFVAGAEVLRPNQLIRHAREKARPAVHVRLEFQNLLAGPLVLGNMRHYGLGLMLPAHGGGI